MTPPGRDWNEAKLSEDPAVDLLEKLGFTYVAPETLEAERETFKETILSGRLVKALKKLNPWLADDSARKVVRGLAALQAASLIEASEKVYTALTYGVAIEHDGAEGKKGHTVRFFDFENPTKNELVVTRQYTVKGAKKHIRPDVVVLVNGIPLAIVECKSPTLGEGWKLEAIDQFSRYQELDDKYRELGAPKLFETVQVLVATCGQSRHAHVLRFFLRVRDKDDLDACVAVLEPGDIRAQFDDAFKKFSQSLDMMLPDPRALPYAGDARWLGKIRQVAAAKFRDDKIDISDCGAKVRKLIEEAVAAEGIQILVRQVSLFTPEFEEKLKALKSQEAQASEMEHAIRHEIHVKLEENPVFFTSLRERLEQLIEDRKAKRIDAAQQLKLFEDLRRELRGHAEAAEQIGLSETGFAIYGLLVGPKPSHAAERKGAPFGKLDDAKKELASLLEEQLEPQVGIVDWVRKDDVQREMRKRIKRQLRAAGLGDEKIDATAEGIVDLLKRRRAQ